jgi:hypothetical protein
LKKKSEISKIEFEYWDKKVYEIVDEIIEKISYYNLTDDESLNLLK